MLNMSQINHFKDLSNGGHRISEISQKTGTDLKTIRKYLSQDALSHEPPITKEKPSKLDPFKTIIQEWSEENTKHWCRQHQTAQWVYQQLMEEHGYTGNYSVVQCYMKKCRSIQTEKVNLELIWDPSPAQVDQASMKQGNSVARSTLPRHSSAAMMVTVRCLAGKPLSIFVRGFRISLGLLVVYRPY